MGNSRQRILQRSDDATWIEVLGIVQRLLHDERQGAAHQRFILDLRNGQTLLIVHNIDIAARVPLGLGARVQVRGLYEWNDLGGLVHWTHSDPHGVEPGGYIRFSSSTYQ
jgi:hypothetical protein